MTSSFKRLLTLGHSIWEAIYKHTDDDMGAIELLRGLPIKVAGSLESVTLGNVAFWLFAGRWVDQGAPRVLLDDQLAASLMATDVGLDSIPFIKPPWKAFMIEIPPGLLDHEVEQETRSFRRILVHFASYASGPQWFYWAMDEESTEDFEEPGIFAKATTEQMILKEWDEAEEGVDDQISRISDLIGRLILSLCLALSDPTTTTLREQKRSKGRGNRFRTPYSVPDTRNFIVGRPITVDCRPAIRDYVEGRNKKKGSISVQLLVRGHWKHQVHGVGRALRKLIHIEPYWKGPEEAKILLRATKVQG